MAKQAARRLSATSPTDATDRLNALNGAALEAMQRCSQNGVEQMTKLGDELSQFVTKRVQHDAEFGQSLGGCRSWTDVMELQRDWFATMTNEYTEETQRLMEMTAKMWVEGLQPFYESVRKAAEEKGEGGGTGGSAA